MSADVAEGAHELLVLCRPSRCGYCGTMIEQFGTGFGITMEAPQRRAAWI